MKRCFGVGAAVAVGVVLLAATGGGVHAAAAACSLTSGPVLLDATVSDGLNSYPSLVRGKEALVRFYFGLPSGCTSGQAIRVNSAQLTVKNGTTTLSPQTGISALAPIGTATPPDLLITSVVKQIDATSDPKWAVPGSVIAAGSSGSAYTATFQATVNWQSKTSPTGTLSAATNTTFSVAPGTRTTPITKPVAARTKAIRLLIVPMGTGPLSSSAQETLQNALNVFSRLGPFPDSGGRLGNLGPTSTAGVRYTLNSGYIDLTPLLDPNGKFCGNAANWSTIDSTLAQTLHSYNGANPTNLLQADKVVGVVDDALSPSPTPASCFLAEASVSSPDAWIRLIPSTATATSPSGTLLAQEIWHTWGFQPFSRSNGNFHSINIGAHSVAGDAGKTYNIMERAYVKSDCGTSCSNLDRTALINDMTGVTDSQTFLEQADWNGGFCFLGGPTTSDCTTPGVTGLTDGVTASTPPAAIEITVKTDGTKANTSVKETLAENMLLTAPDPNPATADSYHIVQRRANGNILLDFRPPSSPADGHEQGTVDIDSSKVLITAAVSRPVGSVRMELWKGAPAPTGSCASNVNCLYSTADDGSVPSITSSSLTTPSDLTQAIPGGSVGVGEASIATTAIPPKVDIFLLQDETASFGTQKQTMQDLTQAEGPLIQALDGTTTNYATGVAGFRDFARDPWGGAGDWIYKRYSDITAGGAGFISGTPLLSANGGNDTPEGYLEALHYLATSGHTAIDSDGNDSTSDAYDTPTGQQPSWRDNAKRVVLLATDAECHVKADAGGWPGDDGTTDAATTANILKGAGITVIGLTPQGPGTDAGEIACVKTLADTTGGTVQKTSTDASTLKDAIIAGLNNLNVTVAASATCTSPFTLTLTPASQQVTSGTPASFARTLNVPNTVKPGVYSVACTINSTIDGQTGPGSSATFTIDVSGITGPHTLITVQASDNSSGPLQADLFMKCGSLFHVLEVAATSDASGKFLLDTNRGCPGGGYYISVNDGWETTPPTSVGNVTINNAVSPPGVGIASPTPASAPLEFSDISLVGSGRSQDGTPLTDSQLVWTLDGNQVGTGTTLDLKPSGPNGWGSADTNQHTLTLAGTDSSVPPTTTITTITFYTLGDKDKDGIPSAKEAAINACRPASLGGPLAGDQDANPYNATEDNDGDGASNADDGAPCTAETDYEVQSIFVPTKFDLSAPASTFTLNGMYSPFRDLAGIAPGSVRISKITGPGGFSYSTSGSQWTATKWVTVSSLAAAVFNKAPLAGVLNAHPELIGKTILITVTGDAVGGTWHFHTTSQTQVIKS